MLSTEDRENIWSRDFELLGSRKIRSCSRTNGVLDICALPPSSTFTAKFSIPNQLIEILQANIKIYKTSILSILFLFEIKLMD